MAVTAGAILLLSGCDVTDPIYNTAYPKQGKITLTTDWSGIGNGLTVPAAYTLKAGDFSATLTGTTSTLDHLFDPGKHPLSVYNTPEHITVSGNTATVASVTGNAADVEGFVHNAPGWLFTSSLEAAIEADAVTPITAVMQQQVRQLTLLIEPTGGTSERINRIEGYLSGAAATLDFASGTHTNPANVELAFEKITSGDNAGKWSATVRLLGTAGTRQMLNALIHFSDDTPSSLSFDSDLTEQLAAFNANKREPLALGGKVVETPTEAGFTVTITDWEKVKGGPITAE